MTTAAVIGLGSIGVRHATNLASLGCEVIGFDTAAERLQMLDRIEGARAAESIDAALEEGDVAVIATAADSHVQLALSALEAGRATFIEKPLSLDLAGTESLEEAAARGVSMVGYNLRFLPALVKAASLISDGAIGRITTGQIEFGYDLRKWNPERDYRKTYSATRSGGGGVLLDAIHEIDLLLWLCGPIESVVATIANSGALEIETEDTVAAIASTGDGGVISLTLDYLSPVYRRGFRIDGDEGALRWDWTSGRLDFRRGEAAADFRWKTDVDASYIDEMACFLDCAAGHRDPPVSVAGGIASLEVAIAIREAATSGERVYLGEQPDE